MKHKQTLADSPGNVPSRTRQQNERPPISQQHTQTRKKKSKKEKKETKENTSRWMDVHFATVRSLHGKHTHKKQHTDKAVRLFLVRKAQHTPSHSPKSAHSLGIDMRQGTADARGHALTRLIHHSLQKQQGLLENFHHEILKASGNKRSGHDLVDAGHGLASEREMYLVGLITIFQQSTASEMENDR